jgi:hypothetical protein
VTLRDEVMEMISTREHGKAQSSLIDFLVILETYETALLKNTCLNEHSQHDLCFRVGPKL